MTEPTHKKTMLVWRPPAGAAQQTIVHAGAAPAVGAPEADQAAPPPTAAEPAAHGEPAHVSTPATLGKTVHADEHADSSSARPSGPSGSSGSSQALPEGALIGNRYVVKSLAGQGGFAGVYRATDKLVPNHEVAVKLLNAPAASPEAQEAAMRELTLIASVSHPSVVQFKDFGWHAERLFFAMPWYRGKTLSSAMPMGRAEARGVFERSAYGLQAMHDAGICHYDIKPDNIFLADIEGFEGGFPVLLDLGIAAKRGEKPTALTPDYAAPETASSILDGGATQVGTAADVFSLALSLRNVLEPDSVPQVGESLPAFLHQRSTQPISPPAHRDLKYLAPLFTRWLSLDPAERPTAAEFAVQLAALTAPEERRKERKRLLMRIVPVVLVLGLIVTVLALQLKTTTKQLVETQQAGEQQVVAANQRFEQLKSQSRNELDEKLLLAQEFQSQRDRLQVLRDQLRTTLDTTTAERDRTRTDLRTRTRERDQTRRELDAQTLVLQQTQAALDQKTRDVEARTRELAQLRSDLQTRSQDLAQRTQERDRTQAELTKHKADLKQARSELAARTKELEQAKKARDKTKTDLDKRTAERDAAREQVKSLTRDLARRTQELAQAKAAAVAATDALRRATLKARKPAAPPAAPGTDPKR
jgi:eukaryotic-like serine/threonine-protein kinase